jgi:hypothetical protein
MTLSTERGERSREDSPGENLLGHCRCGGEGDRDSARDGARARAEGSRKDAPWPAVAVQSRTLRGGLGLEGSGLRLPRRGERERPCHCIRDAAASGF